jgi:hypothetical protein
LISFIATVLTEGNIFGEENIGDPLADLYTLIGEQTNAITGSANFQLPLFLRDLAEELSVQASLSSVSYLTVGECWLCGWGVQLVAAPCLTDRKLCLRYSCFLSVQHIYISALALVVIDKGFLNTSVDVMCCR